MVTNKRACRPRKKVCTPNPLQIILMEHRVIPNVIQSVPEQILEVNYRDDLSIEIAGIVTPTQVQLRPFCEWQTDPGGWYTLVMLDPDAPSRKTPTFGQWLHWLVVNIQGDDLCSGETRAAYIGAGPPKGTDLHRYCFLVYKQLCKLDFNEPCILSNSGTSRPKFKVKEFAAKYALGEPVAVNFFRAEWDDLVPILYKQLGVYSQKIVHKRKHKSKGTVQAR